jgi:hypothetical protein
MSILAAKLDEIRTAAAIAKKLSPAMQKAMTAPTFALDVVGKPHVVEGESGALALRNVQVNTVCALIDRGLVNTLQYDEGGMTKSNSFTELGLLARGVLLRGADVMLEEGRQAAATEVAEGLSDGLRDALLTTPDESGLRLAPLGTRGFLERQGLATFYTAGWFSLTDFGILVWRVLSARATRIAECETALRQVGTELDGAKIDLPDATTQTGPTNKEWSALADDVKQVLHGKFWIIPTEGARLTDRHDVLGPYNTVVLAAQVAANYRAEGIACDVIQSVTRPVATCADTECVSSGRALLCDTHGPEFDAMNDNNPHGYEPGDVTHPMVTRRDCDRRQGVKEAQTPVEVLPLVADMPRRTVELHLALARAADRQYRKSPSLGRIYIRSASGVRRATDDERTMANHFGDLSWATWRAVVLGERLSVLCLTDLGMKALMVWDGAYTRNDFPQVPLANNVGTFVNPLAVGVPPREVLVVMPTKAVVEKYSEYYLLGPGRYFADQVSCEHDYRLTDSCPCC